MKVKKIGDICTEKLDKRALKMVEYPYRDEWKE